MASPYLLTPCRSEAEARAMMISIDEVTVVRLKAISKELGRSVEDLAATATEEAALNFFRHRKDDPVAPRPTP